MICQACEPCDAKQVCQVKAIIQIDIDEPVFIESFLCNNCQKCIPACAFGAINYTIK